MNAEQILRKPLLQKFCIGETFDGNLCYNLYDTMSGLSRTQNHIVYAKKNLFPIKHLN